MVYSIINSSFSHAPVFFPDGLLPLLSVLTVDLGVFALGVEGVEPVFLGFLGVVGGGVGESSSSPSDMLSSRLGIVVDVLQGVQGRGEG
jgi:hypothetical protein